MTTKLLLDKQHAAEALSISVSTLQRLVAEKRIAQQQIGRRALFHVADLQAFAESLKHTDTKQKPGRKRLAT